MGRLAFALRGVAMSSVQGTIDDSLADRLAGADVAVGVLSRGGQVEVAAVGNFASRTGAEALVWAV